LGGGREGGTDHPAILDDLEEGGGRRLPHPRPQLCGGSRQAFPHSQAHPHFRVDYQPQRHLHALERHPLLFDVLQSDLHHPPVAEIARGTPYPRCFPSSPLPLQPLLKPGDVIGGSLSSHRNKVLHVDHSLFGSEFCLPPLASSSCEVKLQTLSRKPPHTPTPTL